ncbi:hypothetical protein NDN08_002401 [Rhodosorus marinus]|uniref:Deoxyhypusine hydroxylase n=1 Tax=Rhodosorus marinus TaxID=101924 RepID=A0AAV8UTQ2_9RHOD|nr:hypothetical protein NDN08_002401 [Rhodosorus marinus]
MRIGLDSEKSSVSIRMRTLFGLKEVAKVGVNVEEEVVKKAVEALASAMRDDPSSLVKHEAAYVLGQTENPLAVKYLEGTLSDIGEDPMVRHEAAEALGAIASPDCVEILERYGSDEEQVVRETVEIALMRIAQKSGEKELTTTEHPIYKSVDPAPALNESDGVEKYREMLLNRKLPLYDRYRGMFSLRNLSSTDPRAVQALCEGFVDNSALFKHELAYVLGQVQSPDSVKALSKVLFDQNEHEMVRHEAAEALGSIGTRETNEILAGFLKDKADVVRESCEVALDITEYNQSDQLNYADTISR